MFLIWRSEIRDPGLGIGKLGLEDGGEDGKVGGAKREASVRTLGLGLGLEFLLGGSRGIGNETMAEYTAGGTEGGIAIASEKRASVCETSAQAT